MMNGLEKLLALTIDKRASLLSALKQMDMVDSKLLVVMDEDKFISLISIGDLQRAIIGNKSFETHINEILRKDIEIVVAKESESYEEVKQKMLHFRTEFMPVIDEKMKITRIYFWEDVFVTPFQQNGDKLAVPVVIMAGGIGSRLKPLTNIIPKALVPVGEKPIVELIINKFHNFGSDEFILSVNYKAEMIKYYFKNEVEKTYNIQYIQEDKPLGTAGSLSLLRDQIHTTFFVSNCDIIIDQDYREIFNYHKLNDNEITIVSSLKSYQIPYGILETGENGNLLSIKEKPELVYMINTGMYILEPHLLSEVPNDEYFHITNLIERVKERKGKVGVFPISEKSLVDIGEWQMYQKILS